MAIAPDSSGSTAVTVAATSAVVNITSAATGAWCYAWCALASAPGSITATGWTPVQAAAEGANAGYAILRRLKQAGDTTFTFSFSSAKGIIGWVSYTGVNTVTPDEASAIATNGVTGRTVVPTPTATPLGTGRWAVAFFAVRTTNSANKLISWTPGAGITERVDANNNAAATSPWLGEEIADTNGTVTVAAQSYTATHNASESHDGSAILFLVPPGASGVTRHPVSPVAALIAAGVIP